VAEAINKYGRGDISSTPFAMIGVFHDKRKGGPLPWYAAAHLFRARKAIGGDTRLWALKRYHIRSNTQYSVNEMMYVMLVQLANNSSDMLPSILVRRPFWPYPHSCLHISHVILAPPTLHALKHSDSVLLHPYSSIAEQLSHSALIAGIEWRTKPRMCKDWLASEYLAEFSPSIHDQGWFWKNPSLNTVARRFFMVNEINQPGNPCPSAPAILDEARRWRLHSA